jgi:hypothetical protein
MSCKTAKIQVQSSKLGDVLEPSAMSYAGTEASDKQAAWWLGLEHFCELLYIPGSKRMLYPICESSLLALQESLRDQICELHQNQKPTMQAIVTTNVEEGALAFSISTIHPRICDAGGLMTVRFVTPINNAMVL